MTETKRDLHADLAICSVATAGPWTTSGLGSWSADTKVDGVAAEVYEDIDATFIAEARTGWPHAIERAMNAESELTAARALLIGMRKRVVFAEDKWKRLRAVVATNATGNKGTDINDWDVMLNVMDDIMTGGDGDE